MAVLTDIWQIWQKQREMTQYCKREALGLRWLGQVLSCLPAVCFNVLWGSQVQDYLLSLSTFLSPWRWNTERRDERQPECRPERGGSHPQRPDTRSMRLRSRGKYWQKFWELIGKFQDIITNKILGLTHRERNLLDKMQKENEEKQKSSISYIIVRKSVLLHFFNVCVLDCG